MLAFIGRGGGCHAGGASLEPDEFPVEVEVVVYVLAALEGFVLVCALRLRRHYEEGEEEGEEVLLHLGLGFVFFTG